MWITWTFWKRDRIVLGEWGNNAQTSMPMINMNIKGLHIDLTDSLKEYTRSKLSTLETFIPSDSHVHVEIGRPSVHHKTGTDIYQAEIEVDWAGQTYFVRMTDGDLYAAIDRARDEIVEMIKSGRGKRQALWKRGRAAIKEAMKWDFVTPVKNIPKKLRSRISRNSELE